MARNEVKTSHEQIAATLAHEIKNPLALIRATLQYVELSDKDQTYKKNYDVIYREIDRINDIVVDYMEAGKPQKLNFTIFNVTQLIEDAEQTVFRSINDRGITLKTDIIDDNIIIKADYNKIKQVLINVLQNAKEAIDSDAADGLIEMSVFKTEDLVTIKVSDNGTGISENNLKSIGTPFFTTKEEGTGLGISISLGIIQRHKGSMNITGIENNGTTVAISLPVYNEKTEGDTDAGNYGTNNKTGGKPSLC